MRLEDNMMPVLTGLVFAVVLGTTVQNSDGVMAFLGGPVEVQADDDVFFVRAGKNASLDVLANDYAGTELTGADIKIVSAPACGEVTTGTAGINFVNSESCEGRLSFTYCLAAGNDCAEANVAMNVRQAPVSVADAGLPPEGALVPLPLKVPVHRMNSEPGPLLEGEVPVLNAFVVSFGAPIEEPRDENTYRSRHMSEFFVDFDVSDLKKEPSSDPSLLADLQPIDVKLSALQTARFLPNYSTSSFSKSEQISDPAKISNENGEINLIESVVDASSQG